ncbi:hypothetical protein pb186bvf_007867 [Paramecium bursaria]
MVIQIRKGCSRPECLKLMSKRYNLNELQQWLILITQGKYKTKYRRRGIAILIRVRNISMIKRGNIKINGQPKNAQNKIHYQTKQLEFLPLFRIQNRFFLFNKNQQKMKKIENSLSGQSNDQQTSSLGTEYTLFSRLNSQDQEIQSEVRQVFESQIQDKEGLERQSQERQVQVIQGQDIQDQSIQRERQGHDIQDQEIQSEKREVQVSQVQDREGQERHVQEMQFQDIQNIQDIHEIHDIQDIQNIQDIHEIHDIQDIQNIQDIHEIHEIHDIQGIQEGQGNQNQEIQGHETQELC